MKDDKELLVELGYSKDFAEKYVKNRKELKLSKEKEEEIDASLEIMKDDWSGTKICTGWPV